MEKWMEETSKLLSGLRRVDVGYPLGDNVIRPPSHGQAIARLSSNLPASVRKDLLKFYRCCDGLSWPDVRNGIFIESLHRVLTASGRGEPTSLLVRDSGQCEDIVVIGSDGGGGRFCIGKASGRVLHTSGGLLREGRLEADSGQVSVVAGSFSAFLARLQEDLRAFIADDREHQFML